MSTKSKGYTLIVVLMCAFALTIYGAYSPVRKSQKQQIVCVKFKEGVDSKAIEQHMNGFSMLRHDIPQIVSYTSGKTIMANQSGSDYDVVHYLTFQSEDDIKIFKNSPEFKKFVDQNKENWENSLTVNATIQ